MQSNSIYSYDYVDDTIDHGRQLFNVYIFAS